MAKKKLFIIIDSNSLFHRAYHALPRFTTKKGELVNAVFGFSSILLRALKEFQPDYLAATFDVPGPTFRDEEYEDYKATRVKAPDELYEQIPRIKEVLKVFNIPIYEKEGFEADDVIGTIAKKLESKKDIDVIIVSGDLDTLQLVTSGTRVFTMKKGVQDTVIYDQRAVNERFGLTPAELIDYKGLRGDPSDNIPGVPGIGEKSAEKLIAEFGSLEKLYVALENDKVTSVGDKMLQALRDNKEQAFFSRMLATIRLDVPLAFTLKDSLWGGFKQDDVASLFRELNFNTLITRLEGIKGFEVPETNSEKKVSGTSVRREELLNDVEDARSAGVLSDDIYKLESELVPIIIKMEEKGITLDAPVLEKLSRKIGALLKKIEKAIYKSAGSEFNINSPRQLSEVLFDKLAIDAKGLKKTPGREISTAASELEKLRGRHPIIELIMEQRELQKLFTTYITPLPKLQDKTGRIHSTFKSLGTATGRMSSTKPNLQNIPIKSDFAHEIRKSFIAPRGKKFLACDYSQMELRVVAHLAQDKNMINAFLNDEDIHTNTASQVFGVEVGNVTKEMRYRAKELNFGLIYGMGPTSFARSAGISLDEAREFTQRYLDIFKGIATYMRETKEKAYQFGYVETLFGRKRFLPDLQSPNPMFRAMAERAAINMPVQGTAADIVKMAMVRANRELKDVDLVLQIHDELLWEVPVGVIDERAEHAKKILESVVSLSVPMKVEYKIGTSWGTLR